MSIFYSSSLNKLLDKMAEAQVLDKIEVYILNHEKCGKCNKICYSGVDSHPFACYDGTTLPKYVLRNFMSECLNFSKRTNTSVIICPDFVKKLELYFDLYCRVLQR